ncbi:MAG: NAD-dependent epimerase/dehydratase family protein [Aliidongia sp.]
MTEAVASIPKNIYGVTKIAAESLCELHHRRDRLPVIVLRTSRFFPEADDDAAMRARYSAENARANELLHRRVDIADVVDAHLLALDKAPARGFGRYIVSATTPFLPGDLAALRQDAAAVVERRHPGCAALYAARGWSLFPQIGRVYVNAAAPIRFRA